MGKQVGRLSIRILPDATKFRNDLRLLIARVEQSMSVNLKVVANTREAELELARFRKTAAANRISLGVAASTAVAKAQLAVLSRSRSVTLFAKADEASFLKTSNVLARLSGFRVASNILSDVSSALKNIDLNVPKIARVATAIGTLSSLVLTSSAGLVTLAGDIAKIGNTAFLLPAILAGAATGIITLILALKDSSTQLAELGPAMGALQDQISTSFWDRAKQPILDFVNSVLPQARDGFALTASALGGQAAAVAGAFQKTFANGVLTGLFDKLATTIDIVTGGAQSFAEAITTLGVVGSNYLPRLATWVVKITDQFNGWVQGIAASGELDKFIEDGITNLKLLGASISDIVSIFRGIDAAATAAGGGGLATFAASMQAAAETVNGSVFQTALTTILEGANAALTGLGGGVTAFGNMLAELAPQISTVLGIAGETLGGLMESIAAAIDQPAFKEGLVNFFEGIQIGVDAVGPAMQALFGFIGQLGTTVGELAANIGPVLAVMKETFAPLLDGILAAVTPLIPLLGDALVGAIGFLAPAVQGLTGFITENADVVGGAVVIIGGLALAFQAVSFVGFIAGWVASTAAIVANKAAMIASKVETLAIMALYAGQFIANMGRAAVALGVQTAAWVANTVAANVNKGGLLAYALVATANVLTAIASTTAGLVAGAAAWAVNTAAAVASKAVMLGGAVAMGVATAAQWLLNAAMSANPIALVVIAIAALVAGLIWFFTQTELGKEIWANFTQFLSEAWNNIVAVATTVFTALGNFFTDVWNNIVSFITTVIDVLLAIFFNFTPLGFIIANFGAIVSFLTDVWNNIVSFITTAINLVLAVIVTVVTTIVEVWTAIWTGISTFFTDLWNGIVLFVTTYINMVMAVIVAVVTTIVAAWTALWAGISTFFTDLWNGIVTYVTTAIGLVLSVISSVGNAIGSTWNAMWAYINAVITAVWATIIGFVGGAIANVSGIISAVGSAISSTWSNIWNGIVSIVSGAWNGITGFVNNIVNGITGLIGTIGDTLSGIPGIVSDAFAGAGQWLLDAGASIVQGLIDGINGMIGMAKDAAGGLMDAIGGFFPHSPALEGAFSGRGWTLYSGQALAEGFSDGMDSRIERVRASARSMMGAASQGVGRIGIDDATAGATMSGTADNRVIVEGNVGYNPQEIVDEIEVRKWQTAARKGIKMVLPA